MADELPVKDVLCQAMDYLSKLGSNLRTRSDSLKSKRKDKLNNVIAVQKAADKVLLICELSKKSLGNVEAGVRKILNQIDISQASSGGKSYSKTDKKYDKPKYHYIDYKSRKLKIKTKISLKHYQSVKVLASKMSLEMLDKYSVYHDCKLFRQRKKEQQNANKALLEEKHIDSIALNNENPSNSIENTRRNSKAVYKKIYTDSEDSDIEQKKKPNDINNEKTSEFGQETENSDKEQDRKRRKTSQGNDDNIGCDDENATQTTNKNINGEVKSVTDKNIEQDSVRKPMLKCVSLTKLLKPDVIKNVIKSLDTPKVKPCIKKKKEFDVNKKDKMLQTSKRHNEEFWAAKRKEVSSFKCKEFSVHITRLPKLNAQFLNTINIKRVVMEEETICDITENEIKSSPDNEISKEDNTNKLIETSKDIDSEDEHLIAEANKVKHSLLKESDSDSDIDTISESNKRAAESTVDKIKNALLDSDSDENEDSAEKKQHAQGNEDQQSNQNVSDKSKPSNSAAAKNDLQGNSDSDNRIEQTRKDDSVADSEVITKNLNNTPDKSCNEEDVLKSTSDNVHSIAVPLLQTPEKQRNAKKSLLNDSSDDENEIPLRQRKPATPQSQKKRIRESVQAKHALLRYSSSGSEAENEQLAKNTLDEIKKTLLEDASDDETKVKPNIMQGSSKSDRSHSSKKKTKRKKKFHNAESSDSEEEKKKSSSSDDKKSSSSSSKVRSQKA